MPSPTDEPNSTPRGGRARAGAARGWQATRRSFAGTARATGQAGRFTARATGQAGRFTARQTRRAVNAEGADQSGLSRLLELHAFNAAGDAAVAISLAGTLFFQVPTGEARGQVALFLALTMLPFAIVAPLIGPVLDRFSHGRRWAIGATMSVRAFLAWVLAGSVATNSPWLFPAALGCLVASKAYGVTRAAAVPRLLPPQLTLVRANARVSLAGIVGAGISAPIAILASTLGAEWSLRYAFAIFVVATIWAIRLPDRVDSNQGEGTLTLRPESQQDSGSSALPQPVAGKPSPDLSRIDGRIDSRIDSAADNPVDAAAGARIGAAAGDSPRRRLKPRIPIPGSVAFALLANCGPRWLSGFLTMFMAFLLRDNPIPNWSPEILLGLVIGAAGAGNTLGIALGSVVKRIDPTITVALALVADTVVAIVAALFYGIVPLLLLGLTAGLAQSLAKLSLDSTIQRDVPERVHASAFAQSDTTLQLAWVIGGFVGITMPLLPQVGLGTAASVVGAWACYVLATRRRRLRSGAA